MSSYIKIIPILLLTLATGYRLNAQSITNKDTATNPIKDSYYQLYLKAAAKKQWKEAFANYDRYIQLKDSAGINAQQAFMQQADKKYAVAAKEINIQQLKNRQLLAEQKNSRRINTGIITALLLITAIVFIYARGRRNKYRNEKEKFALQDALNNVEQEIEIERTAYEEENLRKLKGTRRTISENIHDEISTGIAALRYYAEDLKLAAIGNEAKEKLANAEQEAALLYANTKLFMNKLIKDEPAPAYEIPALLHYFTEHFNKKNIFSIESEFDERVINEKLAPWQQNELYLIIKEAVTNTLKHSKANSVKIIILINTGDCFFSISDNGKGFDPEKSVGGIGMSSIRSRLVVLKGILEINTSTTGTSLAGRFPLEN